MQGDTMKRLRQLRTSKNLTQKDVAEFLGVDRTTYVKYETGASEPNFETLQKLAAFFGVSTDYLLNQKRTPALTEKDERDIARELEKTLNRLQDSDGALMFDGEPLDDDTRELLRASLENQIRMAKIIAKQKYTPKKYRKTPEQNEG